MEGGDRPQALLVGEGLSPARRVPLTMREEGAGRYGQRGETRGSPGPPEHRQRVRDGEPRAARARREILRFDRVIASPVGKA